MSLPCSCVEIPFSIVNYQNEKLLSLGERYFYPVKLQGEFAADPGDSLLSAMARRSTEYVRAVNNLYALRMCQVSQRKRRSLDGDDRGILKEPLLMLRPDEELDLPPQARTYVVEAGGEYEYTSRGRKIQANYGTFWKDMHIQLNGLLAHREAVLKDPKRAIPAFTWDGVPDVELVPPEKAVEKALEYDLIDDNVPARQVDVALETIMSTEYVKSKPNSTDRAACASQLIDATTILGSLPSSIRMVRTIIPEFQAALGLVTTMALSVKAPDIEIAYNDYDGSCPTMLLYSTQPFKTPEGFTEYPPFRGRVHYRGDIRLKPINRLTLDPPRTESTLTDFLEHDVVYAVNDAAARAYAIRIRSMGIAIRTSSREDDRFTTDPDSSDSIELITDSITPGYKSYVHLPTGQKFKLSMKTLGERVRKITCAPGTLLVTECQIQVSAPRVVYMSRKAIQGWLILKSVRARVKVGHRVSNLHIVVA